MFFGGDLFWEVGEEEGGEEKKCGGAEGAGDETVEVGCDNAAARTIPPELTSSAGASF